MENNSSESILSPLGEPEMKAIEMKYEGFNYKEIAKEVDLPYNTVRIWFQRGGKLWDFYLAYAKDESAKRKAQANDTFRAHLNNAVRTLVHVMSNSKLDIARVAAAKEVINRLMGEPLKTVAIADETKVNEYLEAIRKFDEGEALPASVAVSDTDSRRENITPTDSKE